MARQNSDYVDSIVKYAEKSATLDRDAVIKKISKTPLGKAVRLTEANHLEIVGPIKRAVDALVMRMFVDAIFNYDVRAINSLATRMDGATVSDTKLEAFEQEFSRDIQAVLAQDDKEKLKVYPEDSLSMAMAKALFAIAIEDIYLHAHQSGGTKPTADTKNDRDLAQKIILERAGGKKSAKMITSDSVDIVPADWISHARTESRESG